MIGGVAIWIAYDCFAKYYGTYDTFSEIIRGWSNDSMIFVFLFGFGIGLLSGHWMWPLKD